MTDPNTSAMRWRDEPATEKQLAYLKQFGFVPTKVLSKGEASDLIEQFQVDPNRLQVRQERRFEDWECERQQWLRQLAFNSRKRCEEAKKAVAAVKRGEVRDAKEELKEAHRERLEFWRDTFREIINQENESEQAYDLYSRYGYRFKMPSKEHIETVLAALDAASTTWDKEQPEYFFKTLETNFPHYLR